MSINVVIKKKCKCLDNKRPTIFHFFVFDFSGMLAN